MNTPTSLTPEALPAMPWHLDKIGFTETIKAWGLSCFQAGAAAERARSERCADCDLPNGCPEHCWCKPDGRAEFEKYAQQMGRRDFEETSEDGNRRYTNPFTQGDWNYWRASRAALATPTPARADEPWRSGLPARQPPTAIDIIEMLCNGLEWNIENHPDVMNVSDSEALQQARAFLATHSNPPENQDV